jgi:hypothetical protein
MILLYDTMHYEGSIIHKYHMILLYDTLHYDQPYRLGRLMCLSPCNQLRTVLDPPCSSSYQNKDDL